MNFSFVTQYNREAVATMAKALRKTVRRKKSRRSHIIGVAVILLALLLALPFGNENNPFVCSKGLFFRPIITKKRAVTPSVTAHFFYFTAGSGTTCR